MMALLSQVSFASLPSYEGLPIESFAQKKHASKQDKKGTSKEKEL
jgi:hypothetical protein